MGNINILPKCEYDKESVKYIFVEYCATRESLSRGVPFEDQLGACIRKILESADTPIKDCHFTYCYRFHKAPDQDLSDQLETVSMHTLAYELAGSNAKIIVLGANAKKVFTKWFTKEFVISGVARSVEFTISPWVVVLGDPQKETMLRAAIINATAKEDTTPKDFLLLTNIHQIIDYFDYLIDHYPREEYVVVDIETSALSPFDPDVYWTDNQGVEQFIPTTVLMLGFSHTSHQCYIVPYNHPESPFRDNLGQLAYQINRLFSSGVKFSNQNMKFDYNWIRKTYDLDGYEVVGDSMIANYLYYNKSKAHSLDAIITDQLREVSHKDMISKYLKSLPKGTPYSYYLVPFEILLPYTFKDVDATRRSTLILEDKLKKEGLYDFYINYAIPASCKFFGEMEFVGAHVDMSLLPQVAEYYTNLIQESITNMLLNPYVQEAIGKYYKYERNEDGYFYKVITTGRGKAKVSTNLVMDNDILREHVSFNSPAFLKMIVFNCMGIIDEFNSVDKSAKNRIIANLNDPSHPMYTFDPLKKMLCISFFEEMLKYTKNAKLFNSYVGPMESYIKSDGNIHTNFKMHSQETGRVSNEAPATQTLPAFSKVKDVFTSRFKNGGMLAVDFSQAELRIVTMISGDDAMRKAFLSGYDIHTATTADIFNLPINEVPKHLRRHTKTIVFGILYGRGSRAIALELGMSQEEAQDIINKFFIARPQLKQWIDAQHKLMGTGADTIMTPIGRRLRIWTPGNFDYAAACRHAVNYPIQGTASDFTWIAGLNIITAMKKEGMKSCPINFVHDSIIFDVYPGELARIYELAKYHMEVHPAEMFPFAEGVPLVVDFEFGQRWGQGAGFEFDSGKYIFIGNQKKLNDAFPSIVGQGLEIESVEDLGVIDAELTYKYTLIPTVEANMVLADG